MKKLKILTLNIDKRLITFKDGQNYIIGNSNSGKTTIFNSIKYALGLLKNLPYSHIKNVKISISINGVVFNFIRTTTSSNIQINSENNTYNYLAASRELDKFFGDIFSTKYIYESSEESTIPLLEFCFLSEEKTLQRKQQWDSVKSICGVNESLIKNIERDIRNLKNEVLRNNETELILHRFSTSILEKSKNQEWNLELKKIIKETQNDYFKNFIENKELLYNSSIKIEDIKKKSTIEIKKKLKEIENIFFKTIQQVGLNRDLFKDLESFINSRTKAISYGEETLLRFILVMAIAKVAEEKTLNFPNFVINDSYLSVNIDHSIYHEAFNIFNDFMLYKKDFQYIEFTYSENIPREDIILNLNIQGDFNVFKK